MKKITLVSLVVVLAIGMYSCKKDSKSTNNGNDVADKYVGNWIGKDTIYDSRGTIVTNIITASCVIKKLSPTEILILGIPSVGDSIKANVGNTSLVSYWGSDDGYGNQLEVTFTYVREGRFEFSQPIFTYDHGFIEKQ